MDVATLDVITTAEELGRVEITRIIFMVQKEAGRA
jgi:purine nucleoside permease